MKLCMSHYSHKSIPDAKFEADSSSGFGDMTSQSFPLKKGTSHLIRLFTPLPGLIGLEFPSDHQDLSLILKMQVISIDVFMD